MSSCLIIYDENNYYIGADTACSVFYNERPYRYSDNMNKIFSCGDDTYFCSGNLYYVQKTVKWINDTFLNLGKIDASMLSDYLINNYHNQKTINTSFSCWLQSRIKWIQFFKVK